MTTISLIQKYKQIVIPEMKKIFNYKNDLEVPKILKVVVNCGIGPYLNDPNVVEEIKKILSLITGQKPVETLARKSISSFKIRKNQVVGLKVTLRGKKMFDFLTRLISVALPRTRDFRGITEKNFDEKGNLNLGVKEHIVFPEGIVDSFNKIFGFEIAVVTNSKNKEESIQLFKLLGFPIKIK